MYSLTLPQNVLYFIQFPLAAIAFCVAEEFVVLIAPCPLSAFNHNRLQGVSYISADKKSSLK